MKQMEELEKRNGIDRSQCRPRSASLPSPPNFGDFVEQLDTSLGQELFACQSSAVPNGSKADSLENKENDQCLAPRDNNHHHQAQKGPGKHVQIQSASKQNANESITFAQKLARVQPSPRPQSLVQRLAQLEWQSKYIRETLEGKLHSALQKEKATRDRNRELVAQSRKQRQVIGQVQTSLKQVESLHETVKHYKRKCKEKDQVIATQGKYKREAEHWQQEYESLRQAAGMFEKASTQLVESNTRLRHWIRDLEQLVQTLTSTPALTNALPPSSHNSMEQKQRQHLVEQALTTLRVQHQ